MFVIYTFFKVMFVIYTFFKVTQVTHTVLIKLRAF